KDVHIHIPEGAIPKDGPSAGITMATALVSTLTGRPVRRNVAMTGEVTLRGYVLPVGGLNEKILAAKRAGVRRVVLPKRNEPQVKEMPSELKKSIEFVFVEHMDEVLEAALSDGREGT
ncbi:MAG TPA: endopeptidase La, partial [Candidatus Latescibacteria bacterium]|nr:endopeptidase La [Candidatus Latescibacterota bacterium]